MDDDGSKAKKRVLPQWMTEDKVDTKKPFPTNVKRKKYRSPRKSTVYCMNEKELVDYALEIINKMYAVFTADKADVAGLSTITLRRRQKVTLKFRLHQSATLTWPLHQSAA
ncbi:cell cycle regulator of non-homologous end joining isoform X2 [Rana temporaria]|uniref:cell cycle regulator of non-homologous end joining isoform X2 n=1 Tax=Rana temporaria TaxID=8407 RepID=UPI001AAD831E|nr:cell cycle regulator of non-homologous end joining isoform X2 [Rana temporaria]XP_040201598.1 cell cycle regulator of non-homologous end joining isoform X2 [Rana temporaria]